VAVFKQNYFQRRTKPRGPRANNRINSLEVQVISSKGQNLGILSTKEALYLAEQEGLDLIDMGKYKYELQKKANKAKKKQKISELKEIKLRPSTEIHDYNFKIKNAQKFLSKKDKVKFTVRFKGREMQHHHLGMELLKRVEDDLKEVGKLELSPKFEGRQMTMVIQPL
jgi:translation initiation factor IF-3